MSTEYEEYQNFFYLASGILKEIEELKKDIVKSVAGNKLAARRARVRTIQIQKKFKEFRKTSVEKLGK